MTPVKHHVYKPPTIVGLSLFGVIRFGLVSVITLLLILVLEMNFIFAIIPPVLSFTFERRGTKNDPDRDSILANNFMAGLASIGLQDPKYPPATKIRGWKTKRKIYGP